MVRTFRPRTRVRDASEHDDRYRHALVRMLDGMGDAEADACAERPEVVVPRSWREAPLRALIAWVDSLDAFWTPERIGQAQAGARTSAFLRPCLGLGALLGTALVRMSDAAWLPRVPCWDSSVLHEATGHEAYVFYWAIKKLSAYGADDGLAAKLVTVYTTWAPRVTRR